MGWLIGITRLELCYVRKRLAIPRACHAGRGRLSLQSGRGGWL